MGSPLVNGWQNLRQAGKLLDIQFIFVAVGLLASDQVLHAQIRDLYSLDYFLQGVGSGLRVSDHPGTPAHIDSDDIIDFYHQIFLNVSPGEFFGTPITKKRQGCDQPPVVLSGFLHQQIHILGHPQIPMEDTGITTADQIVNAVLVQQPAQLQKAQILLIPIS